MTDERSGHVSDFERLARILRRRWPVIVFCVLAVTGSAVGLSLLQEKQYTAKAQLLFRDPAIDQRLFRSPAAPSEDSQREAATNVRLVSLPQVAGRTADRLDGGLTTQTVQDKVDVSGEGQSDVVSVTATDPRPQFAARLANTFALEYIAIRREVDRAVIRRAQRLVRRRLDDLNKANRGELEARADDLKILAALQTGKAELVQPATVPSTPASPKPVRNGVLGAILGLALGLGLAVVLDRLDRRLKDAAELEETFGLPVLGAIPESRALGRRSKAKKKAVVPGPEWDAFRKLRTRLRYFNVDREVRSVLVTSSSPKEGKTTIASNLAIAEAIGEQSSVLLLEADLRKPELAAAYGLAPEPGLSDVLTDRVPVAGAIQQMPVPGWLKSGAVLDVLVAGATPPNPSELMESRRMAGLLSELCSMYELVIIDTPPIAIVPDAIPLAQQVDGVIIACWLESSNRALAVDLRQLLESLHARTLGLVIDRVKGRAAGYYSYGYGDERTRGVKSDALLRKPALEQVEEPIADGDGLPAKPSFFDKRVGSGSLEGTLYECVVAMRQDGRPREEAEQLVELFGRGDDCEELLEAVYGPAGSPR